MNDGGPAFPRPAADVSTCPNMYSLHNVPEQQGMSLRDWFAGMALSGYRGSSWHHADSEYIVNCAYQDADAMLKARKEIATQKQDVTLSVTEWADPPEDLLVCNKCGWTTILPEITEGEACSNSGCDGVFRKINAKC